jgi:hypothetical protein
MKLRSIALAAAAVVACAPAFAVPAVSVDGASTVRVYLSGATALRAVVAGIVLNDICGGSAANATTTLYNIAESGTGFTFNGNFWGITCNVTAAGGALVGLAANTPIAVFKSDAGGSAQGVFPVFFQDQRPFVQPVPLSGCTTTTTVDRVYSGCPGTRNQAPNFGISDVEPNVFKGFNVPKDPLDADDDIYPADGLSPAQQALLQITPVVQTIFGVAVNNRLYDDMFAKQGLAAKFSSTGALCTTASTDENCIPSIGYAEARSLFSGTEANWRLLSNNAALQNSQLNICRRVDGSGTQAAANLHLLTFPCNGSAGAPADWTFSSSAAPEAVSSSLSTTESGKTIANYLIDNMGGGTGVGPMPSGTTFVFEGPGTGDVVSCLNRANNAQGYAIGHVSKENVPGTGLWKHVRLEGANPLRDNAKQGRYDYTVESTVQYLKTAFNALTASQRAFITGFTNEIKKPDSLAKLSTANQQGVAALPSSYTGAFGSGNANTIAFGSRVTRAGNSCNPMTAVK